MKLTDTTILLIPHLSYGLTNNILIKVILSDNVIHTNINYLM